MYREIEVKQTNGIYQITLNRPNVLNAISLTLAGEIIAALESIGKNGDCRVLILAGNGRSFTVGADTTEVGKMENSEYEHYMSQFSRMVSAVEQFPAPVIAMINGFAFGGGAELASVCDIRFGSSQAKFRFPGASYGIVLSAATLSTIVSLPKAKELLLASSIVDAEEAFRIGLLNQLVDDSELEAFTYRYAENIVKNTVQPVLKAKEVLNYVVGLTKEERKQVEGEATIYLKTHTNQRETFSSFSRKRKTTERDW
ncbi:enoyl-CoA hydratase/isomerase family protein [Neobacillus citreus]|uniref:Enoyl-CoA hydratase/isomerase family protein n=1 Tax=Neobacillus citreus TaxID=2833578 RepID=A0A942YDB4_9BACI|nr:enoyl-CoA hydratase/isomerase family protein [Neobacillus citreus]MCH6264341.1 enoyl-CoA hydratase/isomerase family protein [Neobacillus citreus]